MWSMHHTRFDSVVVSPDPHVTIDDSYLSHVRNIKEGGLTVRAAPQVFLHHTTMFNSLVQDRKLVSRKRHHVTAQALLVHIVQCRPYQRFVRFRGQRTAHPHHRSVWEPSRRKESSSRHWHHPHTTAVAPHPARGTVSSKNLNVLISHQSA